MARCRFLLLAFLCVAVVVIIEGGVVVPLSSQPKIVGGEEVDISEAPWVVSVQFLGSHHCGGSIISDRWVLSAAHCFIWRSDAFVWSIRAGSSSRREGGKVYPVDLLVNHEFDYETSNNDISALRTSSPIQLDSPVIAAVTLPPLGATRPPLDTPVRVCGWGAMEEKPYSDMLRAVDIVLIDFAVCKKEVPSLAPDESTVVCAGSPGKNGRSGDSGGPLTHGRLLVGVVSYGNSSRDAVGGVYMDVAAYRPWIKDVTQV